MRKEYKKQLHELRSNMEKAEAFAERCPMFSEYILENILTGEEVWQNYLSSYKSVRTYDGVNRGHFSSATNRDITNYGEEHDAFLWVVYINTLTEYGSHAKYGLLELHETVPVFFYDYHNSTFYCTDGQIEGFLEALNAWKIKAVAQLKIDSRDSDIKEAEEKLREANERLSSLKGDTPCTSAIVE